MSDVYEALNREFNFRHMFARLPSPNMGHMWTCYIGHLAEHVADWLKSVPYDDPSIDETIAEFRAEWLRLSGWEDFYFTITIENALSEFKKSPLEVLDRLIETNALEVLEQNPFLVPNAEAIDRKRPERKTEPVPWFNIHPTYFEMQKIFPRFLAICRGEESLEHVLDVIDEQIDKIAAAYSERQWYKFTIVLLSDKWDRAVFARHRATFDKCRERGIYMAGYWLDKNEIDAYEI